MTTVVLLDLAAALWAIIFRYVPAEWFAKLGKAGKRAIMGGLVVLSGALIYGAACTGVLAAFNWNLTCDEFGLNQIIQLVLAALVNQGTYHLIKEK